MSFSSDVVNVEDTNENGNLVFVHIYENQRRSTLPPYSWGNHMMIGERGNFSDETGKYNAKYTTLRKAAPPKGYKWHEGSEWTVDTDYTETDDEGWSYGIDFKGTMRNYRNNSSVTSPFGRSVRRRLWRRDIVQLDNTEGATTTSKDGSTQQKESDAASIPISLCLDCDDSIPDIEEDVLNVVASTILVVETFENQRRSALPPYDWGYHSMLGERASFSDESGKNNCAYSKLAEASPPPGYMWDPSPPGTWVVDKDYTQTDDEGWSYGIDFAAVMRNYRSNTSVVKGLGRSVRRRRWIRNALNESVIKPVEIKGSLSTTLSSESIFKDIDTGNTNPKSDQLDIPLMKRGYMKKEGVIKNWQIRYFVLVATERGSTLSFYVQEKDTAPFGENLKGTIDLHGATIMRSSVYITLTDREYHTLKVEIESEAEKMEWISALSAHISFANTIARGDAASPIKP